MSCDHHQASKELNSFISAKPLVRITVIFMLLHRHRKDPQEELVEEVKVRPGLSRGRFKEIHEGRCPHPVHTHLDRLDVLRLVHLRRGSGGVALGG